jgi:hypothetical protein
LGDSPKPFDDSQNFPNESESLQVQQFVRKSSLSIRVPQNINAKIPAKSHTTTYSDSGNNLRHGTGQFTLQHLPKNKAEEARHYLSTIDISSSPLSAAMLKEPSFPAAENGQCGGKRCPLYMRSLLYV